MLLPAAVLKAQRLLTEPAFGPALLDSRWAQVLLIEAEVGCGLALWLGAWPRVVRGTALCLFAVFFGVALARALGGARSCACFGNVEVRPWLAALLDLGLFLALLGHAPRQSQKGDRGRWAAFAVGLLALLAFPIAQFGLALDAAYPRLEISPSRTVLGNVPQGGHRSVTLHARNPHDRPVTIEQVQSSCPCLEARGLPWVIAPGEEATRGFVLDLAHEPGFVGRLGIDFRGLAAGQATALSGRVQVTVVPSPSSGRGSS